jgi:hypothetical protein
VSPDQREAKTAVRADGTVHGTSERLSFEPVSSMRAEGAQLLRAAGVFGGGFDSRRLNRF